ncbi:hypothetical protein ACJJTC_019007 [Scirpophaga incertulas]
MALTSAVANAAAAAAAAGAGKKAAQVQLQAELNTDDDWNKFLLRDGLLVVDVYTEWCGPCLGMVGNLKVEDQEWNSEATTCIWLWPNLTPLNVCGGSANAANPLGCLLRLVNW